jgi:hypothetical protein
LSELKLNILLLPIHYSIIFQRPNYFIQIGIVLRLHCRINLIYVCCLISNKMSENIDEQEEARERKAIPREPTEVRGAKESKGTE